MLILERVISGRQPGAQRAALDFAHGGWWPGLRSRMVR